MHNGLNFYHSGGNKSPTATAAAAAKNVPGFHYTMASPASFPQGKAQVEGKYSNPGLFRTLLVLIHSSQF